MKEEKSFFKLMQKVPGGLIIVPMLIGVLANTFIPNVLEIGGFTSGMFKTGTACLLGMFLLLNGASIDVKKIGMPLYKGCTLTLMKFVVGIVLGLLVAKIGGAAGFCGITSMAMIAGITNSAGGLYLGLAQQYGDETDAGAISILSLNDGPFFTMIAMGTAGMASIPIESFIATLIPLIIGIIWGNLDKTFRKVAADAMPIITFFMMIPIGAGMSLKSIRWSWRSSSGNHLSTVSIFILLPVPAYTAKEQEKCYGSCNRYDSSKCNKCSGFSCRG